MISVIVQNTNGNSRYTRERVAKLIESVLYTYGTCSDELADDERTIYFHDDAEINDFENDYMGAVSSQCYDPGEWFTSYDEDGEEVPADSYMDLSKEMAGITFVSGFVN